MFFWTIWFPSSVYSILTYQASYFKLVFLICCVISAVSALLKCPKEADHSLSTLVPGEQHSQIQLRHHTINAF